MDRGSTQSSTVELGTTPHRQPTASTYDGANNLDFASLKPAIHQFEPRRGERDPVADRTRDASWCLPTATGSIQSQCEARGRKVIHLSTEVFGSTRAQRFWRIIMSRSKASKECEMENHCKESWSDSVIYPILRLAADTAGVYDRNKNVTAYVNMHFPFLHDETNVEM